MFVKFFSWIKGSEDERIWKRKNYIIAGVGFLLGLWPGLLYIYSFNRRIDSVEKKERHKEMIMAIENAGKK